MTELCPYNVLAQKWHLTYFVPIDGHFGQMFWDMNFKFVLTLIYKPSLKAIRPKLAILSQKTPKTHQSGQISKPHFAQVSFTKSLNRSFFIHACFLKTNRIVTITKLYFLSSRLWFLLQFLLRGLTWAVLHVWTQNCPHNFGTCPGLPLQFLDRNLFSKVIGLNPLPP